MPTVSVRSNRYAAEQLRWITLDWIAEGYTIPGQFITATTGDLKPGFFAIASSPGQPIELLIKNSGETAERLCALQAGDSIEVSEPMGKGFPVEKAEGRDLVFLVNGSGISAVRPVIEAQIKSGLTREIHFLYGVRTPAHRPFLADLEWWGNAGITIHTVCDEAEELGWTGATGFVQDAANALGLVREDVSVVLCGFPAMLDAAKALYAEAGCPEDQVLTNF